jgi:hypothetical protein
MRIKINDKIYRLEEIESGVDGLMELVEEPKYKDGDFVVNEFDSILILKEADGDRIFDHAYLPASGELFIDKVASYDGIKRHATTEEKQRMIEALAERGKRWNAEKKCIEDMPKRKFKAGDKVRIKHGVSSKTHHSIFPAFVGEMDNLIGKELTVENCSESGFVTCNGYYFSEDWLEPYEELKEGDLAIFWDDSKEHAIIRFYEQSDGNGTRLRHKDSFGSPWKNAIKFESKEQFEKLIKGEI